MALDNLLILDGRGQPYIDKRRRQRLAKAVSAALAGTPLPEPGDQASLAAFEVTPMVTVADGASRRFTVVAVQAADRPGLLAALARAIFEAGITVHSAHIATYGERAVDVFYLAGPSARKLSRDEITRLKPALFTAASDRLRAAAS